METTTSSYPLKKQYIIALNIIMGIYTLKVLWDLIAHFRNGFSLNSSFFFGEFLINYQGGFVRRGLLGEIIYFCATHMGVSPRLFVGVFCAVCVAVVVWFFITQFKYNEICWWLLPLNYCLANMDVIRKDYFFVVSLILIMYCYNCNWNAIFKTIIINLIAIIAILIHEAFFFYCVPLLYWIIIHDKKLSDCILTKMLMCSPMVLSMIVVSISHGDADTSISIAESWTGIFNVNPYSLIKTDNPEVTFSLYGAIGALSWSTKDAICFHIDVNFLQKALGISGFIIRPITLLIVFYLLLNYISTFSRLSVSRINAFSRILITQFFSLLPLFTLLSCDTYRIYFYWLTSTFVFFFLLESDVELHIMPQWYQNTTKRIQNFFTVTLKPPIWLLIVLLLIISVPYSNSDLAYMWENNVIMQVYHFFSVVLKNILM